MTDYRKHIDKLLELYFSGALEGESGDLVRGWLLSDDDTREKEAALRERFEKFCDRNPSFDDYTRFSLALLHDELGFSDRKVRSVERRKRARRRAFAIAGGSAVVAAALFCALVTSGVFDARDPGSATVIAGTLSDTEVTLPDGSTVRLKQGAKIAYNEAGFAENRTMELDGEGFFVVTHDREHPFTVSAEELTVTVLGTEFNVATRSEENTAEVVLNTGSVRVASKGNSITLIPSQKATITLATGEIELRQAGQGEMMRLRGSNLSFDGVPLDEALGRTADYFDVRLHIATDLPSACDMVLSLEKDATLDDALFILRSVSSAFDYSIEQGAVTITKTRSND